MNLTEIQKREVRARLYSREKSVTVESPGNDPGGSGSELFQTNPNGQTYASQSSYVSMRSRKAPMSSDHVRLSNLETKCRILETQNEVLANDVLSFKRQLNELLLKLEGYGSAPI